VTDHALAPAFAPRAAGVFAVSAAFPDGARAAYNRRMAARHLNEPIEPMTLGNMRANGVRSLDVCCWGMPPPGDPERRPVARSRGGADVRSAHGVHAMRHDRRRRAAELAGAAAAREPDRCAMAVKTRKVWQDTEEKRALQLLAVTPHGCTQKTLRAHGFRDGLLSRIVRAGFAGEQPTSSTKWRPTQTSLFGLPRRPFSWI
jgi:hypothetical protein